MTTKKVKIITAFILLLSNYHFCIAFESIADTSITNSFEKGKVLDKIFINETENYSLFLPTAFSARSNFPVIILLDPSADGLKTVRRYQQIAEKNNCILIGSNNVKNGVAFTQLTQYTSNLILVATQYFANDSSKIAIAGFSGGAKVALACGAVNERISTLIYSGATLPVTPNHKLTYIGFAGIKDMNYVDLVLFDQQIKKDKHFLIEWKGIHEWPNALVFEDALKFLNTNTIDNYNLKKIKTPQNKIKDEYAFKQELLSALYTKDIAWWKNLITQYNLKKKQDIMFERLMGHISLSCNSLLTKMILLNDVVTSKKILTIYKLADPQNKSISEFENKLQGLR